jgi:hypothetical protein
MEIMNKVMGSLQDTEVRRSREYFVPGQFWLKINEVKTGRAGVNEYNPDGDYDYFAVEFEIINSITNSPSDLRPTGTFVNWMVSMKHSKMERMYARDIKNFLMAAYTARFDGNPPNSSDIDGSVFKKTVDEDQPLAGVRIKGIAKTVPTKSGGEFTALTWVYWDGSTPQVQPFVAENQQADHTGLEAAPF